MGKSTKSSLRMSWSDIIDRWTILIQKADFSENAQKELESLEKEIKKFFIENKSDLFEKIKASMRLGIINAKIWEQESFLRDEFKDDPGNIDPSKTEKEKLEIAGKRTFAIRNYNKKRIDVKNLINELTGDNKIIKVNHISENKNGDK